MRICSDSAMMSKKMIHRIRFVKNLLVNIHKLFIAINFIEIVKDAHMQKKVQRKNMRRNNDKNEKYNKNC